VWHPEWISQRAAPVTEWLRWNLAPVCSSSSRNTRLSRRSPERDAPPSYAYGVANLALSQSAISLGASDGHADQRLSWQRMR